MRQPGQRQTGQGQTGQPGKSGQMGKSSQTENQYVYSDKIEGGDIKNGRGQNLGTISNLVVDINRGETPYAVVSFGGVLGVGRDSVAVPMDAFSWNSTEKHFVLETTKERLEKAPDFDPSKMEDLKDDSWTSSVRSAFDQAPGMAGGQSGDMDRRRGQATVGGSQGRVGSSAPGSSGSDKGSMKPHMLMSDLRGSNLVGSDGKKVGSINDVILDRSSGKIHFITMETGGVLGVGTTTRPVPWEATQRVKGKEFRISNAPSGGENAPTLNGDNDGRLGDKSFRDSIYAYYKVEPRGQDGDEDRDGRDTTPQRGLLDR